MVDRHLAFLYFNHFKPNRMKYFAFPFINVIVYLVVSCTHLHSQNPMQEFVNDYFDKRDQYSSLTVEIEFRNKFFSMSDTIVTIAQTETVCQPADTLFGGHLFMRTDKVAYAYDGQTAYFGDIIESSLLINELSKNRGESYILDWVRDFVETSFLTKNQQGRTVLLSGDYNPVVMDTMIGEWPCKGIHLTMPDQEEFTNFTMFVAIDTIEYMLRHRSIAMWFQENEQYQSWTYNNPEYGHKTELTMLNDTFLASFKHQERMKDRETIQTPDTQEAIDYSNLKGTLMNSGEPIDIKDVDAEIIILDFWYSACYPCIKSIPEVNKLYHAFKDKNVAVYGVNIIDDEIKNKSRMEKYVRNNPMAYPTIMADRATYSTWVREGYPMLLVLDGYYQYIGSHSGFAEHLAEEVGAVLEKHLKD